MKRLALLPCLVLVAACSSIVDPSGPIVDLKGVDPNQYEDDLADCQGYADEVKIGKQVAIGAAGGAAVGGAIGAASGRNTTGMGQAAGTGAVYGGTITGLPAAAEYRHVLRECLRGRGYRVLN